MNEIICPHCDKAFKVDETGYADILKQVRNREFEKKSMNGSSVRKQIKIVRLELLNKSLQMQSKNPSERRI